MVKHSIKITELIGLILFTIMCMLVLSNVCVAEGNEKVTVDVGSNLGAVDHKANGLLLGVTEIAPSDSIIAAIKPSSWRICDKWDTLSVGDRLSNIAKKNGYTTQAMDILSDYIFYNYGNTEKSGPFNEAYYTVATNQYLSNHQGHSLYAIDLYNEPDFWIYPQFALNTREKRNAYWNVCYRTIRANPNYDNVKICGPSTNFNNISAISTYLDDAYVSSTYPDIITFHFPSREFNPEAVIQAVKDYCSQRGYPSRPIWINEDFFMRDRIYHGYPGTVARIFGYAERMGVRVTHTCWPDGDNINGDWYPMLDGLVDMNGHTRSCYWMYKAYADMTGSMLNVSKSVNYDAAASKDMGNQKVVAILGSMNDVSGTVTVNFTNITKVFSSSSVDVLVQKLTPGTEPVSGPTTYSSGSVSILNNTVSIDVDVNNHEGVIITLTNGSPSARS